MKRRIIVGALVSTVAGMVLFLTLQGPRETFSLSEKVRSWAVNIGYKGGPLQFRSDFHLVEYFVVGFVFSISGIMMKWRLWIPGVVGCGFGLIEEMVKILLPTREFGIFDLLKDFIGVWVAVFLVYGIGHLRGKKAK